MYFSRFLLASATTLLYSSTVTAGVPRPRDYRINTDTQRHEAHNGGANNWSHRNLFRVRRDDLDCDPDEPVYKHLMAIESPVQQTFCNIWLDIPPATSETDYTPMITKTTMGSSIITVVSTTRTTTTVTTTETATITPQPVLPRAANLVATIDALITSAIASGTEETTVPTTENSERVSLETGFSTACSCLLVDPTSTITMTYTAPASTTIMPRFKLHLTTDTVTKSFTTTTTVTLNTTAQQAVSGVQPSGSPFTALNSTASTRSSTISGSVTVVSNSGTAPPTTFFAVVSNTSIPSTAPSTTVITSSGIGGSSASLKFGQPVATALPFNCPADHQKHVTNIVGGERQEYLILCDTAIVTDTELFSTTVGNPTECAAECSFVNDAFQKAVCQAASFTTVESSSKGDCLISGLNATYVTRHGSVTAVLVGVYTGGDNCAAIDFSTSRGNISIDTASLVTSIASMSVSVTTPGFVTAFATGGVDGEYYSTAETDSLGVIRYSWYSIYRSSSSWWAAYETEWTCTNTITQSIIVRQPITSGADINTAAEAVTTIIVGITTTIALGNSTTSFTAGGASTSPATVAASTTSNVGIYSTGSATVIQRSTGSGIGSPSVVSVSTEALSSTVSANVGSNTSNSTTTGGLNVATLSGATFTYNSTGGVGTESPSPTSMVSSGSNSSYSSTEIRLVTGSSGETIIYNTTTAITTEGEGSIVPAVSSGIEVGTVSRATFTSNITFGAGTVIPTFLNESPSVKPPLNLSGVTETASLASGQAAQTGSFATATSGVSQQIIFSQTFTANTTGGVGTVSPLVSEASSLVSGSGTLNFINVTSVVASSSPTSTTSPGDVATIVSGATATYNSTGGFGTVPVSSTLQILNGSATSRSTSATTNPGASALASTTTSLSVNVSLPQPASAASGSFNITVVGGTAVTSITGGAGIIVSSTNSSSDSLIIPTTTPFVAAPINPIASGIVSSASGAFNLSISGDTGTKLTIGGSGALTPSANVSTVVPTTMLTSSLNSSISLTEHVVTSTSLSTFNVSLPGGTTVTYSTGGSGTASVSRNSSVTVLASQETSLTANILTILTVSSIPTSGIFSASIGGGITTVLSTGGGIILNTAKSSTTSLRSGVPTAAFNVSSNLTEATAIPTSGFFYVFVSGGTGITLSTGGTYAITPSANLSNTVSASVIASPSASETVDLFNPSFSGDDRSRTTLPTGLNTTVSGTAHITSNTIASPTAALFNSTQLVDTVHISASEISGYSFQPSASFPVPTNSSNGTLALLTSLPSVTPPPSTTNQTIVTALDTFDHTETWDARKKCSILKICSSTKSSPSANITLWPGTSVSSRSNFTPPIETGSASVPTAYVNITQLIPLSTGAAVAAGNLSTLLPGTIPIAVLTGTGSVATEYVNSTILPPTVTLVPSSNLSASLSSGSASIPAPTTNSTSVLPMGMSTAPVHVSVGSLCPTPTAPIISVETIVSYITHTLGPQASCASQNGTITGTPTLPLSISTIGPSPTSSSVALSRYRKANVTATRDQIQAACQDQTNIIFNSEFRLDGENTPFGWTIAPDDSFIKFQTFNSVDQHTNDTQSGRVLSAAPGRHLIVSQPVTLCPNKTYTLSSWNWQFDQDARCSIKYSIGEEDIFTVTPLESWRQRSESFTTGSTPEDCSKDLRIDITCAGEGGAATGTNDDGYMIAGFDNVSLTQNRDGKIFLSS